MLRILLADRSASARDATKLNLSRYADEWQVVAEASDEASLLAHVNEHCQDVLILHARLARRPLTDLVKQLRTNCPQAGILVSSSDLELETVVLAAGADAFMYLGDPPSMMITKLRIIQSERIR
jgi:DNA-binding NarL/FixJ family response regulator